MGRKHDFSEVYWAKVINYVVVDCNGDPSDLICINVIC